MSTVARLACPVSVWRRRLVAVLIGLGIFGSPPWAAWAQVCTLTPVTTTTTGDSRVPQFSPDGSQLVFRSTGTDLPGVPNADGNSEIVRFTIATGIFTPVTTTTTGGSQRPQFSPDGSQLVFNATTRSTRWRGRVVGRAAPRGDGGVLQQRAQPVKTCTHGQGVRHPDADSLFSRNCAALFFTHLLTRPPSFAGKPSRSVF